MSHTKINQVHSGPRGWTKKLLEIHGEQKVKSYWKEHGNRKTARHFGVPVSTIDHLKVSNNWKRPMEKVPHILWGIARGNSHPSEFSHLTFQVSKDSSHIADKDEIQRHAYYLIKRGTFIGWCLLNHDYTLCHKIYIRFRGDARTDWIESYEDLIEGMKSHGLIKFEQRHFNEVATLHKYYKQRDPAFRYEDQGNTQGGGK